MTRSSGEGGVDLWRATVVLLLAVIALPMLLLIFGCLAVPVLAVIGAMFGGGA